MLVSSIGYFNNRNIGGKEYPVNSRVIKTDNSAGFGHDQNNEIQVEKNLLEKLIDSCKSLFTSEKSDNKEKSISVIA